MFLAAHWLACFGSAIDKKSIEVYFADEEEEPGELKKYLAAMYWSMTTLSTVGYGDITPKTDEERAYAILAMVTGGALYGYVIGSLTSIVTETGISSRAYNERMELIYSWLEGHNEKVPRTVRRRLRRFFKRTLVEKSVMEDYAIVSELSPELGAETAFYLVDERVKRHPMFCKCPPNHLILLVGVLRTKHVNAHEHVVKDGDAGIAMYVLIDGLAKYESGSQWIPKQRKLPASTQPTRFASKTGRTRNSASTVSAARFQLVTQGDSFGEEVIFALEQEYTYTIVSLKQCEFHCIHEDDFKERYQHFPQLRKQMYEAFLRSRGPQSTPPSLAQRAELEDVS
mmetsp:Transcript_105026/g.182624  ORF Transcript_105026/g.182624 Transcript_105026/m.182624 type:complete len:341 (+) Transcript_105026:1-1023(+)